MLSHCSSSHWKRAIPTPTNTALGIRTAPLIQCAFFSIGSHQHVANNFLGLIKKRKKRKKRRKEAEKSLWKVKTKNQTLLLFYFHCPNLFSIILHVETTNITWYRYPNQQFTMDSYCSVSVIFHPSICGFQIVLFIPFQQPELSWTSSPWLPQKNLLPVSRSNKWVNCKLWLDSCRRNIQITCVCHGNYSKTKCGACHFD